MATYVDYKRQNGGALKMMDALDLPWFGYDIDRYKAEVLKFLQQTPGAADRDAAVITLHESGRFGSDPRTAGPLPVDVKGNLHRVADFTAQNIVACLTNLGRRGWRTYRGVTVVFHNPLDIRKP
jgi:tetrahydromethanopterin S-methyltransferase subunit A